MKKSMGAKLLYFVLVAVVLILLYNMMAGEAQQSKERSLGELYQMIENGEIYSVGIYNSEAVIVAVKNDANSAKKDKDISNKYDYYATIDGSDSGREKLTDRLNQLKDGGKLNNIQFLQPPGESIFSLMLPYLIMIALMGAVMFFIFQQTQGANSRAAQFSKASAKMYVDGKDKINFDVVAGADEEKAELAEIVDFLKNPKKYADMGARIPKGVLLVGRPGTGKTLLAKAVAGEAGVPFFSITGSDFVELYVGVGASRVRDLFAQAKRNAPCIIFIDEIDAVGRHRGAGLGGGHDEREQTLNQLLVEMDGFNANTGIIVMAATNRADILDPALMRSGRFDRQIHVLMPDVKGREAIFRVHARNKKLAADVNPTEIAKLTIGFTGADIENLLNEAALLAVRADRREIVMQDIKDAITKVLMGPEKKSRKMEEKERKLTAYHEAGHAIAAKMLEECDEVSEISIIGRGSAGGYTMTMPVDDRVYSSKQAMLDNLVMGLGGRTAEELIMNDISTGASGDIRHITDLAHVMVTEYGMCDDIGPMYLGGGDEVFIGMDFSAKKPFSDIWSAKIDDAVHDMIEQAHERCRKLLEEHIDLLHKVAAALLEREKISGEEFNILCEGGELPPLAAEPAKTESAKKPEPAQEQPAAENAAPESAQEQASGEETENQ